MTSAVRIDSHHHFWRLARGDYDWLSPELKAIYCDFLPQHLQPLLERAGIDKTVLIQAAETTDETDFILGLAEEHDFVAGVVGWVNMETPDALATLDVWAKHPKFLGIRPVIQDIPDPDWMLKAELDPVFRWVIDNDFTFDALVKPIHLDNLIVLLARYPELRVVVDHGAKPQIAHDEFSPWSEQMAQIAEQSSAYCKLSGLATEAGDDPSYSRMQPYMAHLLKHFGANRLMWGSDWPVCTLATPYQNWINCTDQFLADLSSDEKDRIMGLNAQAFYALTV